MATEWTKETPAGDGWFWIKYKNRDKEEVKYPAYVCHFHLTDTVAVRSAGGAFFVEGEDHGGKGMKHDGKLDKSLRFGPQIAVPQ